MVSVVCVTRPLLSLLLVIYMELFGDYVSVLKSACESVLPGQAWLFTPCGTAVCRMVVRP